MQVRSQPHNLYLVAFAAIAPAAAPIANHFATRAILRSTEPPFAARRASSRSLPSAWLLTFSIRGKVIQRRLQIGSREIDFRFDVIRQAAGPPYSINVVLRCWRLRLDRYRLR